MNEDKILRFMLGVFSLIASLSLFFCIKGGYIK